ncbi:hypothetical protein EYC80_006929 [Monilinia laxa]|uniref:C2H2-type domain-containing protein n=1 Tax=Monilinia laxa TaxID=61186 RepID=A0A5N6JZN2_MONLA|nr:hypothetical protein EYC80_006929 [Monilinia laxa]
MNFQNFAPAEPNKNPSSDAYHQGFCDVLNLFAPVSNMIIGQEFVPVEVDSSIAPIERQAITLAQPSRPTASNVPSTRRFACNFAGCVKTFGRQGDCDRYMKKHGTTFDYPYPEPECSKQFDRLDKM